MTDRDVAEIEAELRRLAAELAEADIEERREIHPKMEELMSELAES